MICSGGRPPSIVQGFFSRKQCRTEWEELRVVHLLSIPLSATGAARSFLAEEQNAMAPPAERVASAATTAARSSVRQAAVRRSPEPLTIFLSGARQAA